MAGLFSLRGIPFLVPPPFSSEIKTGGYDYVFVNKPREDWECPVCKLTMKDPVQIVGCGHRLCNICMASLLRSPFPKCPTDRQPLMRGQIFQDAACHREILNLEVRCPYLGCSWTGELRAVKNHELECLFQMVECPIEGCKKSLAKHAIEAHVATECPWRKIKCDYCQQPFPANLKQEHFDVCEKFPVHCTNECGLTDIPREKLEVHIRDECPAAEVECEYKKAGCDAVFPRSDAKSHLESQVERHLNLAFSNLQVTQSQVQDLVSLVKDQSQQIDLLKSKVLDQAVKMLKMDEMMFKVHDQAQKIETLTSKVKDQSQQLAMLENITDRCVPFVWKIVNFQVSNSSPVFKVSEPFYLFKGGYRLRIKLHMIPSYKGNAGALRLSGLFKSHNKPEGDCLSLYINVIPGEYDSVLPWPFKESVRVTLIDQNPTAHTRVNITNVIKFKKEPKSQPNADDSREYGISPFVDLETLRSRSYIKDNVVLIMVSKE